jgi:hypothetical protein
MPNTVLQYCSAALHCLLYENTTYMHGQQIGVLLIASMLKSFFPVFQ